jgi:hypothetical protein
MESSVKSISRPVIDRLPVTSLEEFACRQLDRVRSILLFSLFVCLLYLPSSCLCYFCPDCRFSLGATALARGDHQAPMQMSAAQALNANENAGAAVGNRVHKFVT